MILGYIICCIGEDWYTKRQGVPLAYGVGGGSDEGIYDFRNDCAWIFNTREAAEEQMNQSYMRDKASEMFIHEIKLDVS